MVNPIYNCDRDYMMNLKAHLWANHYRQNQCFVKGLCPFEFGVLLFEQLQEN